MINIENFVAYRCTLIDCQPLFDQAYDKTGTSFITLNRNQPFPKQALVFMCLQKKPFENTVGKGEIAHYEQFLLFPQCFLPV